MESPPPPRKKKEFKILGINIPITPDPSILKLIRTDRKNNQLTTSGIYKIKFNDKEGKGGAYVGMIKRKTEERIKE